MKIQIEKIITGGFGLGRLPDGMVVLVKHVLPGEVVMVEPRRKHKSYIEADLLDIVCPDDSRVTPQCPVYQVCGGCDLQHGSIRLQHEIKTAILQEAMTRAGITDPEIEFHQLVPSKNDYFYRQRIRLSLNKKGELGFRRYKTHKLVGITSCPVAAQPLNDALVRLTSSGICQQLALLGTEVEIFLNPGDEKVYLLVHARAKMTRTKRRSWQKIAAEMHIFEALIVRFPSGRFNTISADSSRKKNILYHVITGDVYRKPLKLSWEPGCFSQVNIQQNEQLIRLASEFAGDLNDKRVLDLYCGMGNFSIPLAFKGGRVTGIENNPQCIEWAKFNSRGAGVDARFLCTKVASGLKKIIANHETYDVVLLDPPRQGAADITALLNELAPERIVYISCDPATLMRDIGVLLEKTYRLKEITPVDMFPQTHHIEAVALLEKN